MSTEAFEDRSCPAGAPYRGRIAPSPTGYLHLGHARTFWSAYQRSLKQKGSLIFRNEDLDTARCRPEFVAAMYQDLHWLGIRWQEGPDVGGPAGPYCQSSRSNHYLAAWRRLVSRGYIYPCTCSRKDLSDALQAPHENSTDMEPLYPGTCRTRLQEAQAIATPEGVNWRFKVPKGEAIGFTDLHLGPQQFVSGRDFGDFLVWRKDGIAAYQLAVVVDDAAMAITEVVRGSDLLKSTARQILLARALGLPMPSYFHCALVTDEHGVRLAKRHDAMSLRALRRQGRPPGDLTRSW